MADAPIPFTRRTLLDVAPNYRGTPTPTAGLFGGGLDPSAALTLEEKALDRAKWFVEQALERKGKRVGGLPYGEKTLARNPEAKRLVETLTARWIVEGKVPSKKFLQEKLRDRRAVFAYSKQSADIANRAAEARAMAEKVGREPVTAPQQMREQAEYEALREKNRGVSEKSAARFAEEAAEEATRQEGVAARNKELRRVKQTRANRDIVLGRGAGGTAAKVLKYGALPAAFLGANALEGLLGRLQAPEEAEEVAQSALSQAASGEGIEDLKQRLVSLLELNRARLSEFHPQIASQLLGNMPVAPGEFVVGQAPNPDILSDVLLQAMVGGGLPQAANPVQSRAVLEAALGR